MARISVSAGCVAALMLACLPVDYGGVPSTSDLQYFPDLWGALPDGGRLPDGGELPPLTKLPDGGAYRLPDGGLLLFDGGIGIQLPDGGIGWRLPDGGIGWPGGGGTGGPGGTGGTGIDGGSGETGGLPPGQTFQLPDGGTITLLPYFNCVADDPCQQVLDADAGLCVPADDARPCATLCGFSGQCRRGACEYGSRPDSMFNGQGKRSPTRDEKFFALAGNHYLGTAFDQDGRNGEFRVLDPLGLETQAYAPDGETRAVAVDGDAVVLLRATTPWTLERFSVDPYRPLYTRSGSRALVQGAVNTSVAVVQEWVDDHYELQAFDAPTGDFLWALNATLVSSYEDALLVLQGDRRALLDARTGAALPISELAGVDAVTFAGDFVILGGSFPPAFVPGYQVRGRTSGLLVWEALSNRSPVAPPLAVRDGVVYLPGGARRRLSDGAHLSDLTGAERVAFDDEHVYSASLQAVCAGAINGGTAWCQGGNSTIESLEVRPDGVWWSAAKPNRGAALCHVSKLGVPISAIGFPDVRSGADSAPCVWARPSFSDDYVLMNRQHYVYGWYPVNWLEIFSVR